MKYLIFITSLVVVTWIYWRYFYFFRDPKRIPPSGNNILSPADGTIVYVESIEGGVIPFSIKGKKRIELFEITHKDLGDEDFWHVGIFMHPTSVHVNRSPIDGIVKSIKYTPGKNLPMTIMWWRVLLGIRRFEKNSPHILSNERNTIIIEGKFPVCIVQIADIYVNKIVCNVQLGENIKKGMRIGAIKMGSQVDLFFPKRSGFSVLVKPGDKVFAGESIIAK
ncbi:MAG: phosphatidylserine decarboxylase [Patescibacteria group bacterium]|jgi:phosphatidylserine decarboxylase